LSISKKSKSKRGGQKKLAEERARIDEVLLTENWEKEKTGMFP